MTTRFLSVSSLSRKEDHPSLDLRHPCERLRERAYLGMADVMEHMQGNCICDKPAEI